MEPDFRRRFLDALYRHTLHIVTNLSIYFSPNTHLIGEAVVLHALGVLFPEFRGASGFERIGREVVAAQMDRQVRDDGNYFRAVNTTITSYALGHVSLSRPVD